jgi:hypothetical protein
LILKHGGDLVPSNSERISFGSGLLNNPNGIDLDAELNFWIADTGNRWGA